jgi:aspartate racemase
MSPERVLLTELERLASAGADLAIVASNSPHLDFDEVAAASPLPLISIVEETAKLAAASGYKRVSLLGARFTMEARYHVDPRRRRDRAAPRGVNHGAPA